MESPLRALPPFLALVLLAAPTLLSATSAEHPGRIACALPALGCPDLVVDGTRFDERVQTRRFAPDDCDVEEGATVAGTRSLLRFTLTTPNVGLGDLVVGNPNQHPHLFEWGECHGHYHFREYADYRLWTPSDFEAWNTLRLADPDAQAHEILAAHPELRPIKGDKRGFCMIDIVPYSLSAPKYLTCSVQGISAGWADEYHHALSGQYVDVTGVPSGEYVLEAEVNAERVVEETSYANNRAWKTVIV